MQALDLILERHRDIQFGDPAGIGLVSLSLACLWVKQSAHRVRSVSSRKLFGYSDSEVAIVNTPS